MMVVMLVMLLLTLHLVIDHVAAGVNLDRLWRLRPNHNHQVLEGERDEGLPRSHLLEEPSLVLLQGLHLGK